MTRDENLDEQQRGFAAFVDEYVSPWASSFDENQALPGTLIRRLGEEGLLVASLPRLEGGRGLNNAELGRLHEEFGRGCASVRNLAAVQGMVAHAIRRWGSEAQRDRWVGAIGRGEAVAAFALTEPSVGSDAAHPMLEARRQGDAFVLSGRKAWISFGAIADVHLVFARVEDAVGAFLVPSSTPGLEVTAVHGMLGLRASALGELEFADCSVPVTDMVCVGPLTFDAVAAMSLDYGRFSTACGCVGLAEACVTASIDYAMSRQQFGHRIADHQLVQQKIARMVTSLSAARLQCREAARLRDEVDDDAVRQTLMAKYLASVAAFEIASDAVQLHGAQGIGPVVGVHRHFRDAKVQEIIEGTTQIQEVQIARLTTGRSSS